MPLLTTPDSLTHNTLYANTIFISILLLCVWLPVCTSFMLVTLALVNTLGRIHIGRPYIICICGIALHTAHNTKWVCLTWNYGNRLKSMSTHWPGGATRGHVYQLTQVIMLGKQIAMNTISCAHSPRWYCPQEVTPVSLGLYSHLAWWSPRSSVESWVWTCESK